MKFSALSVDFSSATTDPLSLRKLARGHQIGVPPKSGYLIAIGSFSLKTVADSRDILLIITSTSDGLFTGVNIDNLE